MEAPPQPKLNKALQTKISDHEKAKQEALISAQEEAVVETQTKEEPK